MLYKYFLLVLLMFSLFTLTACANDEKTPARQTPEVMMGTDCGFDKLKCCATTPTCNYGQQCCVSPNDQSKNYCSENCECGKDKEFCCAGSKCSDGAACVDGICSVCGGKDQVCCTSGDSCSAGMVCSNNKCAECGLGGESCCSGANSCLLKAGEKAECLNSTCVNCGFDGNPSCTIGDKCLPGQILTGKTCERCGGQNEPCCNTDSGKSYDCNPSAGLKCQLGFCQENN